MDMSAYFFCAIFGILAGYLVSRISLKLPLSLHRQWHKDAQDYLSIPLTQNPHTEHTKKSQNFNSVRFCLITFTCTAICCLIFWKFGFTTDAIVFSLLSWSLITIAVIDHETLYIPDVIAIPLIWAGLIYYAFSAPDSLQNHVFGAALGYCAFRLIPVGRGDAKLCAVAGAWLGTASLFTYFMLGSVIGVGVGLAYYVVRGKSEKYPFGPSLVASFFLTIGMQIMNFQPLKLW